MYIFAKVGPGDLLQHNLNNGLHRDSWTDFHVTNVVWYM